MAEALGARTCTLRRSTLLLMLMMLTALTAWAGATGWYILRKDDLVGRLLQRETARQYSYEDRIASLRVEIDRLASRALLDQDGVELRVSEIMTRQSQLETRQAMVMALADSLQAVGGTTSVARTPTRPPVIRPGEPVQASGFSFTGPAAKPTPAPDAPALRGASNQPASGWQSSEDLPERTPAQIMALSIEQLQKGAEVIERHQVETLKRIDSGLQTRQARYRKVIADIGLDADKLSVSSQGRHVGGPLVPIDAATAGPFEMTMRAIQPRIQTVARLQSVVATLPLAKPIAASADISSNFGYRLDPFTRGAAMHTGIDFKAEHGTSVKAAGAGVVVSADHNGGYGNMVEIDHGNGLTTRYAHLSSISVSEGQKVAAETVVGRVGSTGRSTGPHLHYETRISGDAVDPSRFLKVGQRYLAQN